VKAIIPKRKTAIIRVTSCIAASLPIFKTELL
jgi:hypothetical protein